MTPLMTGIYTLFTALPANDLFTAVGGRMYDGEAPQGATYPYVVQTTVSHEQDWTFADSLENALVQFSIYTNEVGATNAGTFWGYLTTLYDDASPTVSGYSMISMIRAQSILVRDQISNVWQYSVDYDCEMVVA